VREIDLTGFGMKNRPGRKRTWFLNYRIDGREHPETIGRVGSRPVTDAHERAKIALAHVGDGIDPIQAPKLCHFTPFEDVACSTICLLILTGAHRNEALGQR